MRAAPLGRVGRYNPSALHRAYQRHLRIGLVAAVALHLLLLGLYWSLASLETPEKPVRRLHVVRYDDLGPPPSLADPPLAGSTPVLTARMSTRPVQPVPDRRADSTRTIPSQIELSRDVLRTVRGAEPVASGWLPEAPVTADRLARLPRPEAPPPDFVAVEKTAVPIRQVRPEYPEVARKTGAEGRVILRAWVDRAGRVRQVVVLQGISPSLDRAAVEAVARWEFTPALQNNRPVDVWISIPIIFRLHDEP